MALRKTYNQFKDKGVAGIEFLINEIPKADDSRLRALLFGLSCAPRKIKKIDIKGLLVTVLWRKSITERYIK